MHLITINNYIYKSWNVYKFNIYIYIRAIYNIHVYIIYLLNIIFGIFFSFSLFEKNYAKKNIYIYTYNFYQCHYFMLLVYMT